MLLAFLLFSKSIIPHAISYLFYWSLLKKNEMAHSLIVSSLKTPWCLFIRKVLFPHKIETPPLKFIQKCLTWDSAMRSNNSMIATLSNLFFLMKIYKTILLIYKGNREAGLTNSTVSAMWILHCFKIRNFEEDKMRWIIGSLLCPTSWILKHSGSFDFLTISAWRNILRVMSRGVRCKSSVHRCPFHLLVEATVSKCWLSVASWCLCCVFK